MCSHGSYERLLSKFMSLYSPITGAMGFWLVCCIFWVKRSYALVSATIRSQHNSTVAAHSKYLNYLVKTINYVCVVVLYNAVRCVVQRLQTTAQRHFAAVVMRHNQPSSLETLRSEKLYLRNALHAVLWVCENCIRCTFGHLVANYDLKVRWHSGLAKRRTATNIRGQRSHNCEAKSI